MQYHISTIRKNQDEKFNPRSGWGVALATSLPQGLAHGERRCPSGQIGQMQVEYIERGFKREESYPQ